MERLFSVPSAGYPVDFCSHAISLVPPVGDVGVAVSPNAYTSAGFIVYVAKTVAVTLTIWLRFNGLWAIADVQALTTVQSEWLQAQMLLLPERIYVQPSVAVGVSQIGILLQSPQS